MMSKKKRKFKKGDIICLPSSVAPNEHYKVIKFLHYDPENDNSCFRIKSLRTKLYYSGWENSMKLIRNRKPLT
jgi:hypothetical protein